MTAEAMAVDGRAAEVESALCRSALYEALATAFRPPTAEAVRRLTAPDVAVGLVAAARAIGGEAVEHAVARLGETDVRPGILDAAYQRLFGHVARGETPLFETEYGGDELFQQPQTLADVGGFYAAFGLTLAAQGAMRADHVACECEFLMFLARKEAWALEAADGAMLDTTRRAIRLFLRDHLARFAPALASHLERTDPDGFYGALGTCLRAVLAVECARLDVPLGPETLRARPVVDDGVPAACGSCPSAAPDVDDDGD
jgi:TorA maturation chaperone TorD